MLVSPEMMTFYQYLRHRPNNQLKHNQAVLAVGLKLTRIMFHVIKHREYYDPEKGEYNLDELDDVIEFDFPHDQDVYYFYTQQVAVFMNLYNWAKELPDISENK